MLRGVPVTAVTAILKLWPTASAYGVLNVAVPPGWVTGRPASPLMLLLELQFVSFGFVLEQSRTATVAVPVLSQYRAATTLNGLFTNTGAMKLSSPLASATGSTRKHLNELPWEPVGPVSHCGPVGPWRPCRPCGPVGPVGPAAPVAPVFPVGPVGPAAPVVPVGPLGPAAPVGPVGPCVPWAPVAPCGPCAPVGPVAPSAPVQSAAVHDPSAVFSSVRSGSLRSICRSPPPFRSHTPLTSSHPSPVCAVCRCAPVAPGTPCSPCGPVAPCGPSEP